MSTDVCEHCGHPELSHEPERCIWCEADREVSPNHEVCPGFRPDMFNMWRDDDESDRSPEPTRSSD